MWSWPPWPWPPWRHPGLPAPGRNLLSRLLGAPILQAIFESMDSFWHLHSQLFKYTHEDMPYIMYPFFKLYKDSCHFCAALLKAALFCSLRGPSALELHDSAHGVPRVHLVCSLRSGAALLKAALVLSHLGLISLQAGNHTHGYKLEYGPKFIYLPQCPSTPS